MEGLGNFILSPWLSPHELGFRDDDVQVWGKKRWEVLSLYKISRDNRPVDFDDDHDLITDKLYFHDNNSPFRIILKVIFSLIGNILYLAIAIIYYTLKLDLHNLVYSPWYALGIEITLLKGLFDVIYYQDEMCILDTRAAVADIEFKWKNKMPLNKDVRFHLDRAFDFINHLDQLTFYLDWCFQPMGKLSDVDENNERIFRAQSDSSSLSQSSVVIFST